MEKGVIGMDLQNPLYKNQGIHTVNAIFTVEKDALKVLLIKRNNAPYKDMWTLVSGALYNNETFEDGTAREIYEKTGLQNITTKKFNVYSKLDRSPVMRMIGIANICIINAQGVQITKQTEKTYDADWFDVKKMPELGFDHTEIFADALNYLKEQIYKTDIVRALLPEEFTMPMLQNIYEAVLNKQFDRRNFSKKILTLNLLKDLKKQEVVTGKKPAKLYAFQKKSNIDNVISL
jgi:ADP-ribose pyrophosphatase YjhB (NUDIX family)